MSEQIKSISKSDLKRMAKDDKEEYSFFPIHRPILIQFYYQQSDAHWVPKDVDMSKDREDMDKCSEELKLFIEGLLAFFAPADGIVTENIFENFQQDTSMYKEAKAFYAAQGMMEMIHGEMYSQMVEALIRDPEKKGKIYNSIYNYNSVHTIANFMFKYMSREQSLLERILAFSCVEGILFNSAFACIYWIKKMNMFRGFCKANEFIARDEAIHTRFAVVLFLLVKYRDDVEQLSEERAQEIVNEAVQTNIEFTKEFLQTEFIGMNREELIEYTKCTADILLESLDYNKLYDSKNPFDWMAVISLPNKTNFFEDKVSEYSKQADGELSFSLGTQF